MVCDHLRQLYQLCLDQKIRLSGADLIHIVCEQCGHKEICPSNLREESETPPHAHAVRASSTAPVT